MLYPIMTTACGQYRVQDCLCGDCEVLDTPESNANQDQRRQLEACAYFYAEANAGLHDSYDSMIEAPRRPHSAGYMQGWNEGPRAQDTPARAGSKSA